MKAINKHRRENRASTMIEPLESRTLFTVLTFDVPLPNNTPLPAAYGNHVAAATEGSVLPMEPSMDSRPT